MGTAVDRLLRAGVIALSAVVFVVSVVLYVVLP
jgi:hypothetical protein